MVITFENNWVGLFYLAWKHSEAAGRILANGTAETEIHASSEIANDMDRKSAE
jgi:hypothetical protein